MKNDNNQFDIRTKYTHTINPNTGREVVIGGDRFFKLMEHGFKYDVELNRLYDKPLPPGTPKYIPKPRTQTTDTLTQESFYGSWWFSIL